MKNKLVSFFSKMASSQNSKLKNMRDVDGLYEIYRSFNSSCSKEQFKKGLKEIFAEFLEVNYKKCFSKKVFNKALSSVLATCVLTSGICLNTSTFATEDSSKSSNISGIINTELLKDKANLLKDKAKLLKNKALDLKEQAIDKAIKTKKQCVSYCEDHPYTVGIPVAATTLACATGIALLGSGYAYKNHQFKKHNSQIRVELNNVLDDIKLDTNDNNELNNAVNELKDAFNGGNGSKQISYNNTVRNVPSTEIVRKFLRVLCAQINKLKDFCMDEIKYEKTLRIKSANYGILCQLGLVCKNLESLEVGDIVPEKFEHISDDIYNVLGDVITFGKQNKNSVFGKCDVIKSISTLRENIRTLFRLY